MAIQVDPASDRSDRRRFLEFPYTKYRGHPNWIPPLRILEAARFTPGKYPFYEHAEVELFLAREGGIVVGRIAAIDDALHRETHAENLAAFGYFEAESEAAAVALLGAVEKWARARGRDTVRGPLNPSLNDSAGLLIDAFDRDPMLMMPYNPSEYPRFLEHAGYRKIKDLLAWTIALPWNDDHPVVRTIARFRGRLDVTIRTFDRRGIERELERFHEIYCRAWSRNWGFVPPTAAESRQLVSDLKQLIDPALVLRADVAGVPVGCAVAVPDLNQVLKGTDGRLFPRGWMRWLARKRLMTQGRLLLAGVIPEYRHGLVYVLLMTELLKRAGSRYRRAEFSWVLEDNSDINNAAASIGATRDKTYRVYQKEIR